ncbi:DUF4233 domain-containing protein [Segeticoccus rhizosphaerae]|uniref:DUF4233 domain-containing protein n=1 Tax=Segeticoccus rhizosphaerae TaxID=1104777 RepID=UPI0010BFEE62|nr:MULTISPECIES: DUF4233 domain-containing protein [Intrasporangiaceae]
MKGLVFYGVPGKMARRFAAMVIASQAFAVFLCAVVAYGLASVQGDDRSGTWLAVGSVVAVLCILDAGLMRRPWGVTIGWLLQVVTFLAALVVGGMIIVAVIFLALWVTALVQGRKMEDLTQAHLRAHPVDEDQQGGGAGSDTDAPADRGDAPDR